MIGMRKISLDKLDDLFAAIAAEMSLYLPVDTKAGAKFDKWESGKTLSESLNTVRSAKDFFFPQTENLMDFKVEGKTIEIEDTRREQEMEAKEIARSSPFVASILPAAML